MSIRPFLPALFVTALAACDNLGLSGEPEQLTVEVDAIGASQISLVTSTNWIYMTDPACNPDEQNCPDVLRVLAADTTTTDAPLRRTFRFTRDLKYFVEVFPAGGVTATLKMLVEIDGKEWYNEARELAPHGQDGNQETLQFVYQWRQPTIQ